ncbi:MAG: EF-hand domain-containing protein [Pseudomonadota bacterium]
MKKQILSAAFITVISASALAEDSVAVSFNDLDTNSDNALSIAETITLPGIAIQWNDLDKNGDGQLSRDEYTVYQLPAPAAGAS